MSRKKSPNKSPYLTLDFGQLLVNDSHEVCLVVVAIKITQEFVNLSNGGVVAHVAFHFTFPVTKACFLSASARARSGLLIAMTNSS